MSRYRRCFVLCPFGQSHGCRGRVAWNDSLSGRQADRHAAFSSRYQSLLAPTICRAFGFLRHLGTVSYREVLNASTEQFFQEMDSDANIVNVRFTKSVIASKEAFTYEAAQKRKDDKSV